MIRFSAEISDIKFICGNEWREYRSRGACSGGVGDGACAKQDGKRGKSE